MIRLTPKLKSTGLKRTPLKRKPIVRKPRIYNPITKNYYPVKPARKPSKIGEVKGLWRKPLKPMSKKMIKQRKAETELSLKLAELSGNRCEVCGVFKPPLGLHKHEIITRGRLGNELDKNNCLLLCNFCHNHRKYPKSGTPLSIDEQLALAKKLHENMY